MAAKKERKKERKKSFVGGRKLYGERRMVGGGRRG